MKYVLLALLYMMLADTISAQRNEEPITLKCGNNEAKIDSSLNMRCSFFTDSIVKVQFSNPQQLQKIQVVFTTDSKQAEGSWHNVDITTGFATFSLRDLFLNNPCMPSRIVIYYHRNNMNIQHYILNIEM